MALCLPRKRRATSLATRPRTLSVASITNHSCTTSAALALKVLVMSFLLGRVCRALFHGRRSSDGNLLGGVQASPRSHKSAAKPSIIGDLALVLRVAAMASCQAGGMACGLRPTLAVDLIGAQPLRHKLRCWYVNDVIAANGACARQPYHPP